MSSKTISQKIIEHWLKILNPKSPFFYCTFFVSVFLFIYVETILSHSRLHFTDWRGHEIVVQEGHNARTDAPIESSITHTEDIFSMEKKVEMEEEEETYEGYDPLIPPENVPKEQRIAWFRRQLPKLEILHSNSLSKQFHSRVFNFLNGGCSVLFHMTWFSPAQFFGEREFLTMDTLFKAHPKGCLLIISRSMDSKHGYRILKPLLNRGFKVYAITPDLPFLVKDTPAEAWLKEMKSGNKDPGYIPLSQNLSNIIRLALLYKYGGVYMDTDIIVLKDFSNLRNAIGAQSVNSATKKWNRLNGAIMIFDLHHPILLDFMQEFASTFDGNKWGYNGPFLVSRVIGRVGNTPGYNLTIFPPKTFYPVDWFRIGRLFRKPENESESIWVEWKVNQLSQGKTYAVHLWNKRSRGFNIEEGSVMERLISNHCIVCNDIMKP